MCHTLSLYRANLVCPKRQLYTEPIWFAQKGSFEKEENIQDFVNFCTTTFKELHEYVYLWFTFNAPEGIAAQGWLTGTKPPAKKNMPLMAKVLHNILESHVRVYQAIKAMPQGHNSRIGILKNIMQLDPWNRANPLDHLACYFGRELVDESIYRFFTTGKFYINMPQGLTIGRVYGIPVPKIKWLIEPQTNEYIQNGGKCLDFIGLNYYCHNYMKNFKAIREPNQDIEIHTNNTKYTIYGEGLYRAIKELSSRVARTLDVPIYVTENGIGTDNDDHRILHNQRYLYALAQAIAHGHDVRGYIHWSLLDNYEWGQYEKHYGLFAVDRSTDAFARTKKPGSAYFEKVIKESAL